MDCNKLFVENTPKVVSPLIRLCRWGMLCFGFLYARQRLSYLTKVEETRKEEELKQQQEKLIYLKEEKAKIEVRDFKEIQDAIFGGDPPGKNTEDPSGKSIKDQNPDIQDEAKNKTI